MNLGRRWLSAWLSLLFLLGCDSVTGSETEEFTLVAIDSELRVFLEAVEVCDPETARCVTTDSSGVATLEFEAGQHHSITATKEGYAAHLVPNVLEHWYGHTLRLYMMSSQELAEQQGRVGAPYPMRDSGTVIVHLEQEYERVTFELFDATGVPSDAGIPFYYDERGNWNTNLVETTPLGRGGFAELREGELEVLISGDAWRCIPFNAWPGEYIDGIRFPIRAGYLTIASARCSRRTAP